MLNPVIFAIILIGFAVCILGNLTTTALVQRRQFQGYEFYFVTAIGLFSLVALIGALIHYFGQIMILQIGSDAYYVALSLLYAILCTLSANILTTELFSDNPNYRHIVVVVLAIILLVIALIGLT